MIISSLAYFYQSERIAFLDDQIREIATAIVDSELSDLKTYDYRTANALISEELGPDRVGKFFIVRNSKDEILFQTDNIALLEVGIPRDPRWLTIEKDEVLIRVLNLSLPKFPNRTLQVGAITDSNFIFWQTLNYRVQLMILAIFLLVVTMTWLLSASLFAPLRRLDVFLQQAVKSMESGKEIPGLIIADGKRLPLKNKDEFRRVIEGISQLVHRINLNNKFTKSWTHQMIHEVKTPLTILNREVEFLSDKYKWSPSETEAVLGQTKKISVIITNFLNWAEAAATDRPENLHVIRAGTRVQNLAHSWGRWIDGRLQIEAQNDFEVLCNPEQFDQLVENIVTNALKYSKDLVKVSVLDHQIRIQDSGPGLPQEVLERMGTPFNRGPKTQQLETGTGLGLAWVKTISDLYAWSLKIESSKGGVTVLVGFPELSKD